MADVGRGGAVVVVKPRFRSWGLCTCGWVAKPRLFLSSAKVEALIHAARHDCEPAIPLIQPGVTMIMNRQGALDADRYLTCRGRLDQVGRRPRQPCVSHPHSSSDRERNAVRRSTSESVGVQT